jgi:iron complex transport system substrate-binding protein
MRIPFFAVALSAVFLFPASLWGQNAAQSAIAMTDGLGRRVELAGPARRVVSLTPALTEILFAVGAGDQTVGVTEYCNYPAAALTKTKVGGFSGKTVSIETIVALHPDLVLISAAMHEKVAGLLAAVGVASFALEPTDFEGVCAGVAAVGRLTGRDEGAAAVVAGMRDKLAALAKLTAGRPRPRVFWELWDDPLMTSGGATFVNEVIRLAGADNVFADMKEQWPVVSAEEVLRRDPDWIISGDDRGPGFNVAAVAARPGWAVLKAVKAGRIGVLTSDTVYRGGPRLVDAVAQLVGLLYR